MGQAERRHRDGDGGRALEPVPLGTEFPMSDGRHCCSCARLHCAAGEVE